MNLQHTIFVDGGALELDRLRAELARLRGLPSIAECEKRFQELEAENAKLRDLLRDWMMAHGYDREDLRDDMAKRTRAALEKRK